MSTKESVRLRAGIFVGCDSNGSSAQKSWISQCKFSLMQQFQQF